MPAITSEAATATVQPLRAALINATSAIGRLQRSQSRTPANAANNDTQSPARPLSKTGSLLLSKFLPSTNAEAEKPPAFPTFGPPSIENLVASSAEDLSNFRDVTFDIFDDDDNLFGSPLAFDGSENGLWNGRFVPPPPRPPFFVDEPVLSDGLTTCDLCSWAMPTKSTFIFEGTIEKASELGWPLTLIIVSILSALLGAIIMVTVVRCKRKKASNNRNETHVQWWSRNKRANSSNNNHVRRSNIYTAHPADSIRGLQQPSLSAASSLTAITNMGPVTSNATVASTSGAAATSASQQRQHYHQHSRNYHHPYHHQHHAHHQHQQVHQPLQHDYDYEHEYHQPQELQLQLQQLQHHKQHKHQRQPSSSPSSSSAVSTPSLSTTAASMKQVPAMMQLQLQPQQHHEDNCHWPTTAMIVAS